ncbi:MAG: hypothetical protein Q9221_004176 [Calogaya cf. arnoldii]
MSPINLHPDHRHVQATQEAILKRALSKTERETILGTVLGVILGLATILAVSACIWMYFQKRGTKDTWTHESRAGGPSGLPAADGIMVGALRNTAPVYREHHYHHLDRRRQALHRADERNHDGVGDDSESGDGVGRVNDDNDTHDSEATDFLGFFRGAVSPSHENQLGRSDCRNGPDRPNPFGGPATRRHLNSGPGPLHGRPGPLNGVGAPQPRRQHGFHRMPRSRARSFNRHRPRVHSV